jgi:hypothetical protein
MTTHSCLIAENVKLLALTSFFFIFALLWPLQRPYLRKNFRIHSFSLFMVFIKIKIKMADC